MRWWLFGSATSVLFNRSVLFKNSVRFSNYVSKNALLCVFCKAVCPYLFFSGCVMVTFRCSPQRYDFFLSYPNPTSQIRNDSDGLHKKCAFPLCFLCLILRSLLPHPVCNRPTSRLSPCQCALAPRPRCPNADKYILFFCCRLLQNHLNVPLQS